MANPKSLKYSVLLRWSEEDNEWVATVPEWPGLSALAKTRGKAVAEIETVIKMCVSAMAVSQEKFPQPKTIPDRGSGMDRE